MKKLLIVLICFVLALFLIGCGKPELLSEKEIKSMLPYDLLHYSLDSIDYDVSEYTDLEIELRKSDDDFDEMYAWIRSDDGVVKSEKYVHLTFKFWDNVGWQLDSFSETEESFSAEVPQSVLDSALESLEVKLDHYEDLISCISSDYDLYQIEEEQPFYPSEKHIRYICEIYSICDLVRVDRTFEIDFRFHDKNGQRGVKNSYEWEYDITETDVNEEWDLSGLSFELKYGDYNYLYLELLDVYEDVATVNALSASYYGTEQQIIHGALNGEQVKRYNSRGEFIKTAYSDLIYVDENLVYYWLPFQFGYETWDIIFFPDDVLVRPAAYKFAYSDYVGTCYDNRQKKANTDYIHDETGTYETISAGLFHTAALKSDGTVVAVGKNDYGQCNVSDWNDIVDICAYYGQTLGLKSDGSVVAVGRNDYGQCNVSDWRDIVDISTSYYHTVGLRSDGTVVVTGYPPADENYGQCDVSDWRDIVDISTSYYHTVGLKSDGTAIATGLDDGRRNVGDWHDIVAIETGFAHTVGLKSDGTVLTVGYNDYGQCDLGK